MYGKINETNYDIAKEISVDLIETICKYDWLEIKRLQKEWEELDRKCKII